MKKILLMGNPNVGKSAIFWRLTGVKVIISNYPGTTVEFTEGFLQLGEERAKVVDVPGTYVLQPTSKAEEVAVEMLKQGDIVINIVDATNLERNLYLTLQLLERDIPLIVALNMWDDTKHRGIEIDVKKLEEILGVPVVPTCGLTAEGIKELVNRLLEAKAIKKEPRSDNQRWQEIGKIVERIQRLSHRHHTLIERLEDLCIKPFSGILIAIGIVYLTFKLIRFLGEGLSTYLLNPGYNNIYYPIVAKLINKIFPLKFLQDLLLGTTPKAMESFGVLSTGIYIPIVIVLPYILSFYLVLSFLEDLGYLPRLAVLLDNILHMFGLHGYSTIPIVLGLGCKVPSLLANRVLETRREKLITTALTLMIAPCAPQTAMIISLVGKKGGYYLGIIFGVLFLIALISGFILNKLLKGETPELIVEIPPYRLPQIYTLLKKLWMRIRSFLFDAVPLIILGVFLLNVFELLGIIDLLARAFGPVVEHLLGLPGEIISVIVLGFLRKDVSILLLEPFNLTAKQLTVACTFLVLYLPCLATFFVLVRENGLKDAIKIIALTSATAFIVGGILNLII